MLAFRIKWSQINFRQSFPLNDVDLSYDSAVEGPSIRSDWVDVRVGSRFVRDSEDSMECYCTPVGVSACLTGFLNSHTAAAQKNARSAVQRNTSTYALSAACCSISP